MNINQAEDILGELQDSEHEELAWDLVMLAIKYARLRADWMLAAPEERLQRDEERTRAHNSFIDSCNILSRAMKKSGEDNSWRRKIGQDRKDIGDFACLLHAVLGIRAR